jgi:hypothetical protein
MSSLLLESTRSGFVESVHHVTVAVDGCTGVCFGLPLRAMATAYACLGMSELEPAGRLWFS